MWKSISSSDAINQRHTILGVSQRLIAYHCWTESIINWSSSGWHRMTWDDMGWQWWQWMTLERGPPTSECLPRFAKKHNTLELINQFTSGEWLQYWSNAMCIKDVLDSKCRLCRASAWVRAGLLLRFYWAELASIQKRKVEGNNKFDSFYSFHSFS